MGKRRVFEPGWRYANERSKYRALKPKNKLRVKAIMEAIWNDRSCDAVFKKRLPCPALNEITEEQLQDAVRNFYRDEV